ncbi:Hypothetical_protein [Hexamita inflata]|uniref:Hypothetical_protein n=1 Tax=Hexamita inflata TaxID=28002 RepID=A0AA86TVJ4_9EUKA|nr:Hypothetical protein HINF_LOCUS18165 [Hexamita inflata]
MSLEIQGVRFEPIKGFIRYFVSEQGFVFDSKTQQQCKMYYSQANPPYVLLKEDRKPFYIGTKYFNFPSSTITKPIVVVEAFIDNPDNCKFVIYIYIDGDKQNNDVKNLMWVKDPKQRSRQLKAQQPKSQMVPIKFKQSCDNTSNTDIQNQIQ